MSSSRTNDNLNPIEVLCSANPVPTEARDRIASELRVQTFIAEVLDRAERNTADGPQRRNRLVPRAAALAGAFVLFVAVVGGALALGPQVIPFFGSPEPNQPLKKVVFALADDAPRGMDPGLLPERARVVATMQVDGAARRLWAAPTSAGGMCYGWVGSTGGCDRYGTVPMSVSWMPSADGETVTHLQGYAHTRYVRSIEIQLENGDVVRPPLVEVSPPISAAFFSYAVEESSHATSAPVAVVARDTEGAIVTEQRAPLRRFGPSNPIADAEVSEKQRELAIPTLEGSAVIWSAPTRYGGHCAWLEFAGYLRYVAYCLPARYEFEPFAVQAHASRTTVVLAGHVASNVDRVGVHYADGDRSEITPQQGFVLHEIPAAHLRRGHEAVELVARGPAGRPINTMRLQPAGSCFSPLPTSVSPRPPDCSSGIISRTGSN
jgi:hypothetical protein